MDKRIIQNILAFLENAPLNGSQAEAMVECKAELRKMLQEPKKPIKLEEK